MKAPLFSIILPTHNGVNRIGRAITSVITQTFTDYELIVVCDACEDDTQKYVEAWLDGRECRTSIIKTDFRRDGLARNAGLDIAEGNWILFMDDDDWFLHEYCLELLADVAGSATSDIIDFGFVWKGYGYKAPAPDQMFVMVWSRAWRKTFIGDNRFDDGPYESDDRFWHRVVGDNKDVKIMYWNMPMYYYNYNREGSLSWVENRKKFLDIIVTRHDEPWEVCKPFFDMIQLQRMADMNRVNIVIVQDGKEDTLNWKELLATYSFKVKTLTIKHSGTATARNVGMKYADGDWIMFCDIDDRFADVCSLSMILNTLPTDECDIIWGKYVMELVWRKAKPFLQTVDVMNFLNTTCKLYRRAFLEEKKIRFDPHGWSHYEYAFNALCLAETAPFRIRKLTTDFYPYFKTYRKGSLRSTLDFCRNSICAYAQTNVAIAEKLYNRGCENEFMQHIVRAFCFDYYTIYDPETKDKPGATDEASAILYKKYGNVVRSVPDTDIEVIRDEVETMAMNIIQRLYNEHGKEYYLCNDKITFSQWLDKISKIKAKEPADELPDKPPEQKQKELFPVPEKQYTYDVRFAEEPRVVVYCGTRNVYEEMMTSCKSMLSTTPVDKVYFVIEDDKFPYELPEIVECINVSGQKYFPEDGPNFDNSWTYMCMMRAVYPEMFSQYSKLLSLDVDIIVDDDVSDLWDYDMTDYFLAGVTEPQRQKTPDDPIYINFGVVMMNLDKLRKASIQPLLVDRLNRMKTDCPEQTAYNEACAGHILALPNDFNSTVYSHITGNADKERILHYAGQTFWKHYANVKKYANLSWDEVMKRQNALKGE